MKTMIILRANSKEIRTKLKEAGLTLCTCTEFKHSIWLDCHPELITEDGLKIDQIHGLGQSNENHSIFSEERGYYDPRYDVSDEMQICFSNCIESIADVLWREDHKLIDCGVNVDEFIKVVKSYYE